MSGYMLNEKGESIAAKLKARGFRRIDPVGQESHLLKEWSLQIVIIKHSGGSRGGGAQQARPPPPKIESTIFFFFFLSECL